MTDLAVIEGATKRFAGRIALDGISAAIPAGKVTGLVGPDGAGKTTLIRLMTGLLRPEQGSVRVLGRDASTEVDEIHRLIGYMPQKFGLYEDLSVLQNLTLYADLRGVVGAERRDAFDRLLAFTNLAPFTARLAGALSGGMKQKLGLACALLCKPRLLLLDEPSVGVDPISRRELWRLVGEMVDAETAVVWATAYLDEAEQCDHVLLLNDGKLLYQGDPKALTARVAGRSFLLKGVEGRRRAVLSDLLDRPEVVDGVVQGASVRVVLAPGHTDAAKLASVEGAQAVAASPRFEDAFVDLLGGGPGGRSALAEIMPDRPKGGEAVVEAQGLTRRFGTFTAAQDISFTIGRGEIFGLLGPNGAGKSTTFKMLCGLLHPSAGAARVAGLDLRRAASAARGQLGYMAQKFSLYGNLTVLQNLEFFAGVYGLTGRRMKDRVALLVATFGLEPYLATSAETLPLGFKQRLALASSVIHEPPVLFLDEPTSGVDPITRREFWTHINGMVEKGVTILVTTHFMDEAEYCDRIALVYGGKVVAAGSPDALKRDAAGPDMPDPTLEDAFIRLVQEAA